MAGLREAIGAGLVIAPGVFDGIGAAAVAEAGFAAAYLTGNGLSATLLGMPDMGLLTPREVADRTRDISRRVGIPLVVDGDTGYGGPLNVIRTVQELERAGAAAVHLEDQEWPKKCAYFPGNRRLVSVGAHAARIRAASDNRLNPVTLIIARTDARRAMGMDEARRRATAYAAAGADLIFPEGIATPEEAGRIHEAAGVPVMVNLDGEPGLASQGMKALYDNGVRLAIHSAILRRAFTAVACSVASHLKAGGGLADFKGPLASNEEYNGLLGLEDLERLDQRYGGELFGTDNS